MSDITDPQLWRDLKAMEEDPHYDNGKPPTNIGDAIGRITELTKQRDELAKCLREVTEDFERGTFQHPSAFGVGLMLSRYHHALRNTPYAYD